MRREKGTGTVSKMSGARSNPYMVRVPSESYINLEGKKQIKYITIAYTKTKKEGIQILNKYLKQGRIYSTMTFAELHEMFKAWKYPTIDDSMQSAHNNSFNACKKLHDRIFTEIDIELLQNTIDTCEKNYPTLVKIRLYLGQLYRYAIMNNLCKKNYADGLCISKYAKNYLPRAQRDRIKIQHVKLFWEKSSSQYYQMILFMIYTGVRVSEMLSLLKKNVNIDDKYFDIVKGKNGNSIRRVPIADAIFPFVKKWYENYPDCDYLFTTENGKGFKYRNYYDSYFIPLMQECGFDYTPHWCRHTFLSMMKECRADPIVTKKIVGHKYSASLTERVYTHFDMEIMRQEINKLEDWSEFE